MTGLGSQKIEALKEAIAHRRSLGLARLKPDAVDRHIIEQALEAANWAPSNGDTEPWRFTVFTGEARKKLGQVFGEAYTIQAKADGSFKESNVEAQMTRAMSAPVWISIGMEPGRKEDGSLKMEIDEEIMAVACAVQNLHLVCSAYGLIGMWHSMGISAHPHVAEFLGLKAPARLLGFFWCGWPNVEWPAGERGPVSEKVRWA